MTIDLHRASLDDPDAFWGEAARAIDWTVAPQTVLDALARPVLPLVSRRRAEHRLELHRPPRRRRPRRPARARLRLAGDGPGAALHLPRAAGRGGAARRRAARRSASSAATASCCTCRWCPRPCSAMLACARLGAVHSVVFGGFAPRELAIRIDDAQPKVILSASCGIEGQRVIAYKPLLDDAIDLARHQPEACLILQRPQAEAAMTAGRDHDWAAAVAAAAPGRLRAGAGDRSALHPLHLRHDGPAEGRRARQRRPRGGAAVVDAERLRRPARATSTGRPPTSAGWSATRTSSTRRCCTAARRSSTRASRSARPMRARSGA